MTPNPSDKPHSPSHESRLGLYVHVPFCAKTCDFCAFYQARPTRDWVERYLDGIEAECELVGNAGPLATVFWGGGTPGLLAPKDLDRLGRTILRRFGRPSLEWTVELAPGSVRKEKLDVLRELGVTRVSMGVQSFQQRFLEALGRPHSLGQIDAAWELIQAAGFEHTNLDLIFGIPGQTPAEWEADLSEAVSRRPDHLSTYCLTFEEDTALFVKLSEGKVTIDLEAERDFFRSTWRSLDRLGFTQYEISNYSLPGAECRHNAKTWNMGEWIGLGPAAAGQHAGWRGTNVADLEDWLAGLASGRRADRDRTKLTDELLVEDCLVFGLRMNRGVDLAALRIRFPEVSLGVYDGVWERLGNDGLLSREGDGIRLTESGRLVADAVGGEILAVRDAAVIAD